MSNTVISYPIPPYSNVPINAQYYEPSQFVITAVALGVTTTITTQVDHNYVVGQQCRLVIPQAFGCFALNGTSGYVLSIPAANQVVLSINSGTNVNPFISSSSSNQPQILAIGDISSGATNANGINNTITYVPGAFINISPI